MLIFTVSLTLAPASIKVKIPVAPAAKLGTPRRYEATRHPAQNADHRVAIVRGKTIRFKPTPEFDKWEVRKVGRDGTVLLYRSYYGLYTTSQFSIVRDPVETPVKVWKHPAFIDTYFDAKNYAGGFYTDDNDASGAQPPRAPINAFVMETGRARKVGLGTVRFWMPGEPVVTSYEQDEHGHPTNYEEAGSAHTHLYVGSRDYDLGELTFFGRTADRGLVFWSPKGLYRWKAGKLTPWVRLPEGWKPFILDPEGRLLAHREGEMAMLEDRRLRPVFTHDPRVKNAFQSIPNAGWLAPNGAFAFSVDEFKNANDADRITYVLKPVR